MTSRESSPRPESQQDLVLLADKIAQARRLVTRALVNLNLENQTDTFISLNRDITLVGQRYEAYLLQGHTDGFAYNRILSECSALIKAAKKALPPSYKS